MSIEAFPDRYSARDLWPRSTRTTTVLQQRAANGLVVPTYQLNRPQWAERNVRSYADLHATSTTLFACILYRANAVASATIRVYRDINGDLEEQPDHPLRQLVSRPNPGASEAEFLALVQAVADVAGFAPIEKVRSAAGRVVALHVLRPDWCRPIYREQTLPDWEYRVPGNDPVMLPADDMMIYTPVGSLDRSATGMSAVSVALRELGVERAMTDFLAALFQRGAMPLIGLVVDPDIITTPSDAEYIKAQFASRFAGASNWAEPMVMSAIKTVERLGYDLNELAFPDLRDATEVAICQVFGVPPILVGAKVGLDQATYSNYEQARRSFYEDTVTPLWARLDGTFTRSLLAEFDDGTGYSLEFDVSAIPALKEDEAARWTEVQQAPFLTLNEKRRHVGFPDIEGGDVFVFSLTDIVVPAGGNLADAMAGLAAPPATEPEAEAARSAERRAIDRAEGRRYEPITEQRAAVGQANRVRINRLGRAGVKPLAQFWQKQGERILAKLEAYRATKAEFATRDDVPIPPLADMVDWDDEQRQLDEVIRRLYQVAGEAAFDAAGATLGVSIDWSLANPNVARVLDQLADRIVGIGETTRNDVRREVEEALRLGETVDDLADRLHGLFDETYRNRAVTVARTESQVAYNMASVTGYAETGLVAEVQLLDNPLHTTDPGADGLTCAQRNGLVTALGNADIHIRAEHPNGTLSVSPLLREP